MNLSRKYHLIRHKLLRLENYFINKLTLKEIALYKKALVKSSLHLDPLSKKDLNFPEALYPLEKAPVEWWYFTGHLEDIKNPQNKFGFEFCFFKFHPLALRLGPFPFSKFHNSPFLIFHFALTDLNLKKFYYFYDAKGISKINYNFLNLELNSHSLKLNKQFTLHSKNKIAEFNLKLIPLKK